VKRRFFGLIFLLFPLVGSAGISFTQLAKISTTPDQLKGTFSQEKYLKALDAELISTGVFSYQRGKSIHWEIQKPIQNELVMTAATITSKQGDGELWQIDVESTPESAALGQIFFSLLTADWEILSNHFEVTGEIDGQQWHAVLVPIDATVVQAFSRIELSGENLLQQIILHENGGNRTTIRLDNWR
jgi:hypothetical protein